MKKKFGTVLLAGAMVCTIGLGAVLAGCGTKIKPDFVMPEGGFDTENTVTIKFYHTMGQELRDVLDRYIQEFNKLYPNIKVEHEQVGNYDDVRDTLVPKILAGDQPNIAYCYPDHVALYETSGAVQPLDDFLSGGAYKDATVKQVTLDENGEAVVDEAGNYVMEEVPLGLTAEQEASFIPAYFEEGKMQFRAEDPVKMYALPFSKSTEVLYYNKTFFDENSLEVPTTWDEMEQVCARIKEIDTNPNAYPFGYDSEANWFITMCEQYGSGYTSSEENNHYQFDNEVNRAFVQKFADWYTKGYFTTQAIYGSYTSGLFISQTSETGRAYMCIGSSAGAVHQIPTPTDNRYPFEVGIAPIPQVNAQNPKAIQQGPSVCIFKDQDPQKVLASWLFVKFLATSVAFQGDFSMASGYIPVLKSDVMQGDPYYKRFLENANNTSQLAALSVKVGIEQEKSYFTSPAFSGSSMARDQVGYLMQSVFTKSKTIDDAFKYALNQCEMFVG